MMGVGMGTLGFVYRLFPEGLVTPVSIDIGGLDVACLALEIF